MGKSRAEIKNPSEMKGANSTKSGHGMNSYVQRVGGIPKQPSGS